MSKTAMSRILAPLAVFGAVLVAMAALNGGAASPPALSAGGDLGRPSGDPLRDAQAAVRAAPASATVYAGLGDAYLSRARESGDPGFYSRAERAFDVALRRDPRDVAGLVGAGTLAGLRHDFSEQLRLGKAALTAAPELARPLTVIADAQIELGRYDEAGRTIQRLVDLKPALASYARVSYFRELSGDVDGAVAAMRLAVSAGGSPEGTAYVQTLLGDLELARGRTGRGPRRLPLRAPRRSLLSPGPHRTRTARRGEWRPEIGRRSPASRHGPAATHELAYAAGRGGARGGTRRAPRGQTWPPRACSTRCSARTARGRTPRPSSSRRTTVHRPEPCGWDGACGRQRRASARRTHSDGPSRARATRARGMSGLVAL